MNDKDKIIKSRKDNPEKKSNSVKKSLMDKVNNEKVAKKTVNNSTNKPKRSLKGSKNKAKSLFQSLSLLGRISLVIWMVLIISFVILIIPTITGKGQIDYGSRQQPVKVISNSQVNEVKSALEKDIQGNVSVNYAGYRFVVVIDLGEGAKASQGKKVNAKAYNIVDSILPVKDYFSSTDQLNNDLFIYSTDLVPTDYNQTSSFIYETYKNSKMAKAESYDLTKYRDKESYNEVRETMKDNAKGGN